MPREQLNDTLNGPAMRDAMEKYIHFLEDIDEGETPILAKDAILFLKLFCKDRGIVL